jgi:hypothetical protein
MNKNPFLNAVFAVMYIMLVASVMYYGLETVAPADTIIMPIAMISLFTLSAAVMGYLFLYGPIQLYLEGDKKGAMNLFLKTVFVFAIITIFIFSLLFLGNIYR